MVAESGSPKASRSLNAVHAFMRDEGPRYEPALAALGYALALDVLRRGLHA
jgi:hypothetical protein